MNRTDSIQKIFKNILVVDDEENARMGMLKLLVAEGFDVQSAENGCEALKCLRNGTFRLIISDLNMPKLDGLDFLRIVRRDYPEIDIVILTAAGGTDSYIKAMNLGAAEYLCKPFQLDSLKSVMHDIAYRDTAKSN
jgi:DNA-binding NtrC family response regulator